MTSHERIVRPHRDASGKLAPGSIVVELCRGIRAFANGEYKAAMLAFEPVMPAIAKIGGSHAQRELYEDTYIVACLRSGHPDKARQIISRRLDHRPSTPVQLDRPYL